MILLHPFAPHLAEELWSKLQSHLTRQLNPPPPGPTIPLPYQPWPVCDADLLVEDTLELPVQVNGKLRDKISIPRETSKADTENAALNSPKVQSFIAGKTVRKIIVVPDKLVNIVAG